MILPNDPKHAATVATSTNSDDVNELPPIYTPTTGIESPLPSSAPSFLSSLQETALPNIKPSNFVYLSHNNNSVKGTYLIDPDLIIPAPFLPPLATGETEETRKHLFLDSRNGSVVGDVIIVPGLGGRKNSSSSVKKTKVVRIRAQSSNGSATIKVRDPPTPTARRPFLNLSVYSANGTLYIRVPRSFCGPLNIKTAHSGVNFSDGIKADVRLLSQAGGEMRAFLGDWEQSERVLEDKEDGFVPPNEDVKRTAEEEDEGRFGGVDGTTWTGDVLEAETRHRSVNIYYVDEENLRSGVDGATGSSGGFWSKLFGVSSSEVRLGSK